MAGIQRGEVKGAYSGGGSVQRPGVGGNRFCSENGGLGKGPTTLGLESSAPWEQREATGGSQARASLVLWCHSSKWGPAFELGLKKGKIRCMKNRTVQQPKVDLGERSRQIQEVEVDTTW